MPSTISGLENCQDCRFLTNEGVCTSPEHSVGFHPKQHLGCGAGERKSKISLRWIRDRF